MSVTDFLPNHYVTCGVLCNSSTLRFMHIAFYVR